MQKRKFKWSDPSCGHARRYKCILYLHITWARFPLEKRLTQSGCCSAPPHPLPSAVLTLCQPSQAAGQSPQRHATALTSLHNIQPRLYVFSLQLTYVACQEPRRRAALSNLLGLPALSAPQRGDAQLTCMRTMLVHPQTLFILPCSNPALTCLLFPPLPFSLACIVSIK